MPYDTEIEEIHEWHKKTNNANNTRTFSKEHVISTYKKPLITFEDIQRRCIEVIQHLNTLNDFINQNPSFQPLCEGISICKESINYCLDWEIQKDRNGKISYHHRRTKAVSFTPPLPSNWEIKQDHRGMYYYINHKKQSTCWERPVWIFQNEMKLCPWTPTGPQFMRAGLTPEHVTCLPSYTQSNSESSEPTSTHFLHMRRLLLA